ncbi:hypothetical protein HLK59_39105 [Streptomyces sp. S3(2020)]|uniref:hypothetical protein n=1 Tax=Streptomyces sp. S3(2020) TaxID=2732044 RepID=UPI00148862DC|nr:hypothetical protein [Streptomyces sp. S3(2020)]NNN36266.1 hypothetical protein [Streptomyces sp. S3(2020)]
MLDVAVEGLERIGGKVQEQGEEERKPFTSEGPVIDILLRNSGNGNAAITKATFELNRAIDLLDCTFPGGGSIFYVDYDVQIPLNSRPGDAIPRTLRFFLEPDSDGRIRFSIGTEGEPDLRFLYEFTVTLSPAGDGPELVIPKVVVLGPAYVHEVIDSATGTKQAHLNNPEEPFYPCYKKMLSDLARMEGEAKYMSPDVTDFRTKLEAAVTS